MSIAKRNAAALQAREECSRETLPAVKPIYLKPLNDMTNDSLNPLPSMLNKSQARKIQKLEAKIARANEILLCIAVGGMNHKIDKAIRDFLPSTLTVRKKYERGS